MKQFKNKLPVFLLFIISLLSTLLFLYKLTSSPPCLNADEAANAYDAYSVLTTGKDQYGNPMPLRFKSFGDFKLPLLTYLAVPFIKIFGLTELGIRLVNIPFVFFFPVIVYLLAKELLKNKTVGLLAAALAAFAPGVQLLGRQAHEGYLTAFFLTLTFYLFLRFYGKQNILRYALFVISFLVTLFGYHSSRLWGGFFILIFLFYAFKKKIRWVYLLGPVAALMIFLVTDLASAQTRIQNLLFFKNIGFSLKINELRAEGGSRLFYNKLTVGIRDLTSEYLRYFSPQFLTASGDENLRFGFAGVSPITPLEYLFVFIGIYYLFKNNEKKRYFLLAVLLFAPVSGSLSWAGLSVTRTIFLFVPLLIISANGIINLLTGKRLLVPFIAFVYLASVFYSWDFYLFHYPQRATVIRSWQCGYKQLVKYVSDHYNDYDKFYITRKNGQPYIFFLFYLKYPPASYQQTANLSAPDEYGFGQVRSFDKFVFDIPEYAYTGSVVAGYPDDFPVDEAGSLKKIKVGNETIFLIKEIK